MNKYSLSLYVLIVFLVRFKFVHSADPGHSISKRWSFWQTPCKNYGESCENCISSDSTCYWCTFEQICTRYPTDKCTPHIPRLLVKQPDGENDDDVNDDFVGVHPICPSLLVLGRNPNSLDYVPNGKKLDKNVAASFLENAFYVCRINIGGMETTVQAKAFMRISELVYLNCATNLTYPTQTPFEKATIYVDYIYKDFQHQLQDYFEVTVYKCNYMAYTIMDCNGLHEKFKCHWCSSSNQCAHNEDCKQKKRIPRKTHQH